MTKRNVWPMRLEDGATGIGTARISDGKPRARPAPPPMPAVITPKKAPKYRNTKCEHDGIKFDSLKERAHWFRLVERLAAGEICDLELQVPFVIAEATVIAGKKKRARRYIADFVYFVTATGEHVVEDVKGMKTAMYEFKRHLMKTVHNIEIVEI